ncbi:hypothetical protein [Brevundimonas sp.]|uniref:hypothetical protein n=1 Tax=Brevundimonas sp. TaxID=1871086 RepID=UPI002FC6A491
MLVRSLAAATTLALGLWAAPQRADAQIRTQASTPFIIHAGISRGPAPGDEAVAQRGQPLLIQRATSIRAARLEAETPSLAGFQKVKSFPAGTKMFGVYSLTGWVYCAVAETTASWWAGDESICYEDADGDGRFETAMLSGAPFMGVPLFVFELGERQVLAEPAPYVVIPGAEGPSVEFALVASSETHRSPDAPAEVPPVVTVTVNGGFRASADPGGVGRSENPPTTRIAGWTGTVVLGPERSNRIRILGAELEILGLGENNTVRYRVISPAPAQVERVAMSVVRSTTYTPIFIPG